MISAKALRQKPAKIRLKQLVLIGNPDSQGLESFTMGQQEKLNAGQGVFDLLRRKICE